MTEPTFKRLKIALDQIQFNVNNDVFKADQIIAVSTSMLETVNLIDRKFPGLLDSMVSDIPAEKG